ncbi:MAG: PAS domain S-box protein [Actinobacteria bacterium]|nr:PAS domain S-box protein [Actinomycetota bacterium]
MERKTVRVKQKELKPGLDGTFKSFGVLSDLSVFDDIPVRVLIKDADSTWVYANNLLAGDMGLSREEIPGKTDYDFFDYEAAGEIRSGDKEVMGSGTPMRSTGKYEISGREWTAEKIASPVFDENGEVIGVSIFILDVIDSGRAEEKLDQYRERSRSLEREVKERITALEKEREFNDEVLDALPEIVWVYNIADGHFIKCNEAFTAITGYSDKDIGRMNPVDIVSEDDVPKAMEAISRTITDGEVHVELSLITREGLTVPVEHHTVLLKDADGAPTLIACAAMEITQRKWAQQLVEAQRDFAMVLMQCIGLPETLETALKFIMEVTGLDGGLIYDLDDYSEKFNPLFSTGLSGEYRSAIDEGKAYVPDVNVAREGIFIYMGYEDLKGLGFDSELKEGVKCFAVIPVFNGNELLCCMMMVSRSDETVSNEIQELVETLIVLVSQAVDCACLNTALQESEGRFRAVFESSTDAVLILGVDHRCLYINPAGVNALGYHEESLAGIDLREGLKDCPEYLSKWMDWAGEVFNSQKPLYVEDERDINGVDLFSELRFFPIRDPSGEVFAVGIIYRDVTERKIAERELKRYQTHLEEIVEEHTTRLQDTLDDLERSNAELEQFAYIASHDLKEPLRMVSSYIQLIAKRYRGKLDPDADEFIDYAIDGAKRMQELIDDLLAYSRVGTRGGTFEHVDTELILNRAKGNLESQIAETEAVISNDPLPAVFGDMSQMVQLFQNLLGNAMKFKGDGRPIIRVSARPKGDFWEFSVSDNGIGFEPKFRERIFTLFQRLNAKGKFGGTGIGLSVCERIVLRHGGEIWAESRPGEGSTFYFTLPMRGGAGS